MAPLAWDWGTERWLMRLRQTGRVIGAPGRAWMDGPALQALAANTRAALSGAGRPLEIEALLGAVAELAGWAGVAAPISAAMLELVRQRAAMRG